MGTAARQGEEGVPAKRKRKKLFFSEVLRTNVVVAMEVIPELEKPEGACCLPLT